MPSPGEYSEKGYSKAEVEILTKLAEMEAIQKEIMKKYVSKDEFAPIQKLIYGLVGLILVAVASGIIALIIP